MTKMLSFYAITDDKMTEWDDVFFVDLAEAEAAIQRTLKESEELVVVWPSVRSIVRERFTLSASAFRAPRKHYLPC